MIEQSNSNTSNSATPDVSIQVDFKNVEVKRYRLRKKMNLPHEFSLTNYILEI